VEAGEAVLPGAAVGSAGVGTVLRRRAPRRPVLAAVEAPAGVFVADGVAPGARIEPGIGVAPGVMGAPGVVDPGLAGTPGLGAAGVAEGAPGTPWAVAKPDDSAKMAPAIRS